MTAPISSIYQTSNSVKTLRAYYKDRLSFPDVAHVAEELVGISDRAAVILLAAILDDLVIFRLAHALSDRLNDDDLDHAFRFEGPMGGFSHRIEIAYLFGLIELTTYKELNVIREMRNACAHSSFVLNFTKSELANVAKRLFSPNGAVSLPQDTPEDIKSAFVTAGVFLIQTLALGSRAEAAKAVKEELHRLAEQSASPDKSPQP
jgi:DNA-binding MltR family transcriptional regulator